MEDAPLGSSVAESEDVTEIECTLWNASIGGCKDALPALRSSNEDEDEGGQEHHGDGRMCDDLSFGRVGSSGASHESDSNPAECSRQGNEEPHVEMEGHKAIDLVAHDIDPYKDAMRDDPDGGSIAFEAPQFQPQHSVWQGMHPFHLLIQFQIGFFPSGYYVLFPSVDRFGSFPYMDRFDDRYSFRQKI
jgi:hypothetical protein